MLNDDGLADVLGGVLAGALTWPTEHHVVGVTSADAVLGVVGDADLVLPFASVTKPIAAYGVLVAVNDGLVHLDEPAGPDGSTVRHLLAHASGLGPDASSPVSRVETRRIYSNHGFDLLGELVEERTDFPMAEHLDAEVMEPLGMSSTRLEGSAAKDMSGTVADLLALLTATSETSK